MSFNVRRIDYFHTTVKDQPGEGYRLLMQLADLGIKDCLMYKASRNTPLLPWQKWFNKAVSGIRAQVEQFFGVGKQNYGLARARYRGEARVTGHFYLLASCYNLRRALSLV